MNTAIFHLRGTHFCLVQLHLPPGAGTATVSTFSFSEQDTGATGRHNGTQDATPVLVHRHELLQSSDI